MELRLQRSSRVYFRLRGERRLLQDVLLQTLDCQSRLLRPAGFVPGDTSRVTRVQRLGLRVFFFEGVYRQFPGRSKIKPKRNRTCDGTSTLIKGHGHSLKHYAKNIFYMITYTQGPSAHQSPTSLPPKTGTTIPMIQIPRTQSLGTSTVRDRTPKP